jgi:hypothetical protein
MAEEKIGRVSFPGAQLPRQQRGQFQKQSSSKTKKKDSRIKTKCEE